MEIIRGVGNASLREFMLSHPGWMVLDYSQVELWDQCNRKWSYRNIHQLATIEQWAANFSGKLIHPALSFWYTHNGQSPTREMWRGWLQEYHDLCQYVPQARSNDQYVYRLEVAQMHFNEYASRFLLDFDMYDIVNSEVIYWATFPKLDGVVWVSKPDVLLSQKIDGKLISTDFKHSKWDINANLIEFDRQFLSQAYTTNAEFIMKVHMRTELMRSNEPRVHCQRHFGPVEEDKMAEWLEEMQLTCTFIRQSVDAGVFPKRAPRSCNDFNSQCEFYELCNLGAARQGMINEMVHRPPLGYLGIGTDEDDAA